MGYCQPCLSVYSSASHLRVVKVVLCVEDDEHSLVQLGEELPERLLEVDLAAVVVVLQILEEVDEDVGVALVYDPVGLLEEPVELHLRGCQQVREILCKKEEETGNRKVVECIRRSIEIDIDVCTVLLIIEQLRRD